MTPARAAGSGHLPPLDVVGSVGVGRKAALPSHCIFKKVPRQCEPSAGLELQPQDQEPHSLLTECQVPSLRFS